MFGQGKPEWGNYSRKTASGQVGTGPGTLIGFYVNSTTAGTITLYDNTSAAGAQASGVITPAIGFHRFPAKFGVGMFAAIGGTLDVTFFYQQDKD